MRYFISSSLFISGWSWVNSVFIRPTSSFNGWIVFTSALILYIMSFISPRSKLLVYTVSFIMPSTSLFFISCCSTALCFLASDSTLFKKGSIELPKDMRHVIPHRVNVAKALKEKVQVGSKP